MLRKLLIAALVFVPVSAFAQSLPVIKDYEERAPTLKAFQFNGDVAATNQLFQDEQIRCRALEDPARPGRYLVRRGRVQDNDDRVMPVRVGDYIQIGGVHCKVFGQAEWERKRREVSP